MQQIDYNLFDKIHKKSYNTFRTEITLGIKILAYIYASNYFCIALHMITHTSISILNSPSPYCIHQFHYIFKIFTKMKAETG